MSNERDVNTIIRIDKIIEKWEKQEISADECLYLIHKQVEDNIEEEINSLRGDWWKQEKETVMLPVNFVGKLPPRERK